MAAQAHRAFTRGAEGGIAPGAAGPPKNLGRAKPGSLAVVFTGTIDS